MVAINTNKTNEVGRTQSAGPSDAAAASLINNARSNLGWHEGPNNQNPYTQHVMGDAHQPWCAAFVSTMLEQAKIPGISHSGSQRGMWSASAAGLASQFQQAGRYFKSGTQQPQPGDVIFFGGRGGEHHTGIVEKVENGKVYTIEGNSSDKVSERVYPLNSPGIGGYGRVFGPGAVSSDVGIDTSKAGQGTASNAPSGRAVGRGSVGQALDNGVDPTSYFSYNNQLLLALLRAMINGDTGGVEAALAQMFPNVSKEDLADLAKLLKDNPELAAKVAQHPEVLQQLANNMSPEAVKAIEDAPMDKGPVDGSTQKLVKDLLGSPDLKDRGHAQEMLKPLMRQIDATRGNGWGTKLAHVAQVATHPGGWRPH
jgi:hypothetical protein